MRALLILLLLLVTAAFAQTSSSSGGITCGVCSSSEEASYCKCPVGALSVCMAGSAAGGCGAAGTWESSPACTSCCVCSGTTTAPTSYSTTTTSNGNEVTTPAPTSYTTTATSYTTTTPAPTTSYTTTSNGNEVTTPAPTSYTTTATSYTTTTPAPTTSYTTTSNGNEVTTPAPTSYTTTPAPTSYTTTAAHTTTDAYTTTSNGNEVTTPVPPTTTTYDTTAAPPCSCVTVSAVLVLGGSGWLQIQLNTAVWSALFDTLRGDLAYALGCVVGNVTITDCAPANNGLTVSYDVKADNAADAYDMTTKARSLSSSALRATMLLYQATAPSGSNVTIGWSGASYDSPIGGLSTAAGPSNILFGLAVAWIAILMLVSLA